MSQYGWNDCPALVHVEVDQLIVGCTTYLANDLIGIYLHGSLAMDCFNPLRSDLDLLVITRNQITLETKRNLAELLLRVSLHPSPAEISFLQHGYMVPWYYPTPYDFHYSEKWRNILRCELDNGIWKNWNAVQKYDEDLAGHITLTYHRGVCLYGSSIADVFPMVPSNNFIASITNGVLRPVSGLNVDVETPVYTILNSCRTYAYLRTGKILSKDEGGMWALRFLPHQFQSTILTTLDIYRNYGEEGHLSRDGVTEFIDYIRNEIERLLE